MLSGTQMKEKVSRAFARLQGQEISHLDIEIVDRELDQEHLGIPESVREVAGLLNISLTDMVNVILFNFHMELSGRANTILNVLKEGHREEFARRILDEFSIIMKGRK